MAFVGPVIAHDGKRRVHLAADRIPVRQWKQVEIDAARRLVKGVADLDPRILHAHQADGDLMLRDKIDQLGMNRLRHKLLSHDRRYGDPSVTVKMIVSRLYLDLAHDAFALHWGKQRIQAPFLVIDPATNLLWLCRTQAAVDECPDGNAGNDHQPNHQDVLETHCFLGAGEIVHCVIGLGEECISCKFKNFGPVAAGELLAGIGHG